MHALRVAALLSALTLAPFSLMPSEAQTAGGQRGAAGTPQSGNPVPQPKRDKVFDVGSTWIAISLNGKPFAGERPSLTIDKQFQARGFGGCNTFMATAYPLREQRLAVSPLNFTKKSCNKAIMDSERAFFVALRYAQQWDQQGSTLIIKSQNGELRFERAL